MPSGRRPRELRARFTPAQLNRTSYARVAGDGSLLGVYADEGCNLRLDDATAVALLGEAFFKPALNQGKPVEGVAPVRLAQLLP